VEHRTESQRHTIRLLEIDNTLRAITLR